MVGRAAERGSGGGPQRPALRTGRGGRGMHFRFRHPDRPPGQDAPDRCRFDHRFGHRVQPRSRWLAGASVQPGRARLFLHCRAAHGRNHRHGRGQHAVPALWRQGTDRNGATITATRSSARSSRPLPGPDFDLSEPTGPEPGAGSGPEGLVPGLASACGTGLCRAIVGEGIGDGAGCGAQDHHEQYRQDE